MTESVVDTLISEKLSLSYGTVQNLAIWKVYAKFRLMNKKQISKGIRDCISEILNCLNYVVSGEEVWWFQWNLEPKCQSSE